MNPDPSPPPATSRRSPDLPLPRVVDAATLTDIDAAFGAGGRPTALFQRLNLAERFQISVGQLKYHHEKRQKPAAFSSASAASAAGRVGIPPAAAGVRSVAFSPDGECLASAGGRTVKLWHAVPYRERFPAIAAFRAGEAELSARFFPRIGPGADLEALWVSVADEAKLGEVHRRAGMALITSGQGPAPPAQRPLPIRFRHFGFSSARRRKPAGVAVGFAIVAPG